MRSTSSFLHAYYSTFRIRFWFEHPVSEHYRASLAGEVIVSSKAGGARQLLSPPLAQPAGWKKNIMPVGTLVGFCGTKFIILRLTGQFINQPICI